MIMTDSRSAMSKRPTKAGEGSPTRHNPNIFERGSGWNVRGLWSDFVTGCSLPWFGQGSRAWQSCCVTRARQRGRARMSQQGLNGHGRLHTSGTHAQRETGNNGKVSITVNQRLSIGHRRGNGDGRGDN